MTKKPMSRCPICGVMKVSVEDHIKAKHRDSKEYREIKKRSRDSGYFSEADYMTWMRL